MKEGAQAPDFSVSRGTGGQQGTTAHYRPFEPSVSEHRGLGLVGT